MSGTRITEKNQTLFKIVLGIAILLATIQFIGARASYRPHSNPIEIAASTIQASTGPEFTSPANLYNAHFTEEAIATALKDSEQRIDPEFQIPEMLRPTVKFWLKVYTQYSSLQAVLFDSNTMEIYEELDFRKIAQTARNQMVYEITVEHLIKKKMELYRKGFVSLGSHTKKNAKTRTTTVEEKNILAVQWKGKMLRLADMQKGLRIMRGQRDNIIKGLASVETFEPKIEAIFRHFKVPVELIRLSLVESSFNLNARSKVGAAGVWQFMESSGKSYLTIDPTLQIDERLSPLKASAAAAKMLYWNYKYLGSWALAVISYNHGLRNLPRLKGGSNEFAQISHLFEDVETKATGKASTRKGSKKRATKNALGWASKNYYSEFLAVLYAEKYRELFYGESPSPYIRPVAFFQLTKDENALTLALEKGISIQDFRIFNADVENIQQVLPKGYWVVAPSHGEDLAGLKEYTQKSLRKVRLARGRLSLLHAVQHRNGSAVQKGSKKGPSQKS